MYKISFINLFLIIFLISCSSSEQDVTAQPKQQDDYEKEIQAQEDMLIKLANQNNAVFIKPFSRQWSRKHTIEIQQAYLNKVVLFEAVVLDVISTNQGHFIIAGNNYASNTKFNLETTTEQALKIAKLSSKKIIVIADITNISPLPITIDFSTNDTYSKAFNARMHGKSYLVNGNFMQYIVNDKTTN